MTNPCTDKMLPTSWPQGLHYQRKRHLSPYWSGYLNQYRRRAKAFQHDYVRIDSYVRQGIWVPLFRAWRIMQETS